MRRDDRVHRLYSANLGSRNTLFNTARFSLFGRQYTIAFKCFMSSWSASSDSTRNTAHRDTGRAGAGGRRHGKTKSTFEQLFIRGAVACHRGCSSSRRRRASTQNYDMYHRFRAAVCQGAADTPCGCSSGKRWEKLTRTTQAGSTPRSRHAQPRRRARVRPLGAYLPCPGSRAYRTPCQQSLSARHRHSVTQATCMKNRQTGCPLPLQRPLSFTGATHRFPVQQQRLHAHDFRRLLFRFQNAVDVRPDHFNAVAGRGTGRRGRRHGSESPLQVRLRQCM